jgi:hypothetical protein
MCVRSHVSASGTSERRGICGVGIISVEQTTIKRIAVKVNVHSRSRVIEMVRGCAPSQPRFTKLTSFSRAPRDRCPPGLFSFEPETSDIRLHLTKRPMTRALAMSIKKADTSGRMMKAVGAAPCAFVTAVMLAMAVGVAPRLMPLKPAEITAAR